jgi:hypothetical protein
VQLYGRVCLSWCFLGSCKYDEFWWVGGGGGARYFNEADVEKTSLLSQPLIVHFREAFPSACVCWID